MNVCMECGKEFENDIEGTCPYCGSGNYDTIECEE